MKTNEGKWLPHLTNELREEYYAMVKLNPEEAEKRLIQYHEWITDHQWLQRQDEGLQRYLHKVWDEEFGPANDRWPRPTRTELLLTDLVSSLRRQRDDAEKALGALTEHIITHLTAMALVGQTCFGNNHTVRNQRMKVLLDIIDNAKAAFIQDRSDPTRFTFNMPFHQNGWDFRRLAAANWKLQREVNQLKEELNKLRPSPAPDSAADENDPDYIPF